MALIVVYWLYVNRHCTTERRTSCHTAMMITRFNADSKENREGKGKFSAWERLAIGGAYMLGISYEAVAEAVNVSRTYYYELGKQAGPLMHSLTATDEVAQSIILVTKEFILRAIIALYFVCKVSQADIIYFFQQVFHIKLSKGTVYNRIQGELVKALEHDAIMEYAGVNSIASDELYQRDKPIFTVVDLDSGAVLIMEAEEDRGSEAWSAAMKRKKEKGLNPKVNVSDAASGLIKGVQEAFPDIEMQPDIFHAIRELTKAVNAIQRAAMSELTAYCDYEYRAQNPRAHTTTREKYNHARMNIDDYLNRADELRILYGWYQEHTNFNGKGYEYNLSVCNWILDEMSKLYPKSDRLLETIAHLRENMPGILGFLPRLRRTLVNMAHEYRVPDYAFTLMYSQTAMDVEDERYQVIEEKLYRIFRGRFLDAKEDFRQAVSKTYRASSAIENVNGRVRVFVNAKREIPADQFPLLKMMMNMKKCHRSRKPERIGSSALERLTGQDMPDFLDALLGVPHYILSAA